MRSRAVRSVVAFVLCSLLLLVSPAKGSAQSEFAVPGFTEDVVPQMNFQGAAVAFVPNEINIKQKIYIADNIPGTFDARHAARG